MTWSNNIKVDAIGLAAEVVDLRRELEQQAVLLGKGSEREARLLAENAELRKDKARLDYIFYPSCSMRARARMRKFIGTKPYLPPNGLCPWRAGIDDAMQEGKQ